jgi:hypothetical protein
LLGRRALPLPLPLCRNLTSLAAFVMTRPLVLQSVQRRGDYYGGA